METLSQQDYAEKFHYGYDEDGRYSAYKSCQEVSYVELHSQSDMISRNIAFVDTPGLQIDDFCFLVEDKVLPFANAVVFVLSAVSLFFSSAEREYIARNFAGKEMRNVFFVINKIDYLLPEELESIKPSVKAGLSDVFTDSKGYFNEQLYNSRVFFTNAYGALCVHTGEPYTILIGKKTVPVPIDLEDTGIPEFEEALLSFIDEQQEMCKLTMQLMVRTYQRLFEKTLEELKKDRCNHINYYEHNQGNNTDPRMGVFQAMREYIGYCFEDLYGHHPTDLELSLMA